MFSKEDIETIDLEWHKMTIEKLIVAGERLFSRMDYHMGDTDPSDDQDPDLIACMRWRQLVKTITNQ